MNPMMNQAKNNEEPTVSIDVPESVAAAIQNLLPYLVEFAKAYTGEGQEEEAIQEPTPEETERQKGVSELEARIKAIQGE